MLTAESFIYRSLMLGICNARLKAKQLKRDSIADAVIFPGVYLIKKWRSDETKRTSRPERVIMTESSLCSIHL